MAASSASSESGLASSTPLLARVGLLSDIQYADMPDGSNFLKTEVRYYRNSLKATENAVRRMAGIAPVESNSDSSESHTPDEWRCQAVLHLGDLIDGFNATYNREQHMGSAAIKAVMEVLPPVGTERIIPPLTQNDTAESGAVPATSSSAGCADLRCYHLLGNHELMNFPRSRWARELGFAALSEASRREAREWEAANPADHSDTHTYMFPSVEPANTSAAYEASNASPLSGAITSASPLYYDLLVGGRFRVLMLDSFEVSVSGYDDMPDGHPSLAQAQAFLARENPNEQKFSPDGLVGTERRKVAYNGGMGQAQLQWAASVLRQCRVKGQYALLCSHVPFHAGSSHCSALLWNRNEALDLVKQYSDVVLACLHGHDHDGGHAVDAQGVVHHTFEGVLTTPSGSDTFGRMDFYADRLEVTGCDRMRSFTVPILPRQVPSKDPKEKLPLSPLPNKSASPAPAPATSTSTAAASSTAATGTANARL